MTRTLTRVLANLPQSLVSVKDFGAVGDGVTDDTAAIQAAVDSSANTITFPVGTYLMGSVSITGNKTLKGSRSGTIILRPDLFDTNNQSSNVAPSHFNIDSGDIEVTISGFTFNGNEASQVAGNPSASSIKFYNQAGTTLSKIYIDSCTFVNQTREAILLKGMDQANERQYVYISNCAFIDGRAGIGQDDPASPNINGFAPDSIQVIDHIDVTVTDCLFSFSKPVSTGVYSRNGVRLTFVDAATNEDGPSGVIKGCRFYRMGRADEYFDGSPTGNNGLGCIDAYGKGRELAVIGNRFESCLNSAVRGKTNLDMAAISDNIILSTPLAINIGPNTYPNQRGSYTITGNVIKNAQQYAIGVVGNAASTPTEVVNVSITGNVIDGITPNNVANTSAGIYVRYAQTVTITGNSIINANGAGLGISGIKLRNFDDAIINSNNIRDCTDTGIYVESVVNAATINNNQIFNTSSSGIHGTGVTAADFNVCGNCINNVTDYAIFPGSNVGMFTAVGNVINTVNGLSRGIFVASTRTAATITSNTATGTTLPIFNSGPGDGVADFANSWNAAHYYQNSAPPASGTWKVGDITWDSTPSASGKIGWVCITAGTPGTWKAFGAIDP